MEINEEIIASLGRTWYDPRPIPPNWFRSKAAYGFHERIRAEIIDQYGAAPLILIKEPRICRLAPLYLDVLDVLRIEPLVILPVRHPGELFGPFMSVIISTREQLSFYGSDLSLKRKKLPVVVNEFGPVSKAFSRTGRRRHNQSQIGSELFGRISWKR